METQTVGPMTSRERVLAALRREPVDRTAVCNPTSVATVELMDLVDAPFPEANRQPELMARLAATGYTELGFDTIMPVFTIIQESSALGCKIQWEQKDNWPTVRMREPIWEDVDDIKVPPDFLTHQDTRCVLDAIKILKKEFGDEVAVIGKDNGPLVSRIPLLRGGTLPASVPGRSGKDKARSGPDEGSDHTIRGGPNRSGGRRTDPA